MFNKLSQIGKNLQDEISRNLNELGEEERGGRRTPLRQLQSATQALRNGSQVLNTTTPETAEMAQPEDDRSPEADLEPEIPEVVTPEIKSKLKKFSKYEDKYPRLLEAYKVEKMKSSLIAQFEGVLKEYTPVNSISEVGSLVEYLDGLTAKTEMLNEEMRRLTAEGAQQLKAKQVDTERIQNLETQIETLDAKMSTLMEDKAAAEAALANSSDVEELKVAGANIAALESSTSSDTVAELEAEVARLQSEREADSGKVSALEAQLSKLEVTRENHKEELDKAAEAISKLTAHVAGLESDLSAKEEKLTEAEKLHASEIEKLTKKISERDTSAKEAAEKTDKIIGDLEQAKKQLEASDAGNKEVVAQLTDEKDTLFKELASKESIIASLTMAHNTKVEELKLQVVVLEKQDETNSKLLESFRSKISEISDRVSPPVETPTEPAATPVSKNAKKNKKKKKNQSDTQAPVEDVKELETSQDQPSNVVAELLELKVKYEVLSSECDSLKGQDALKDTLNLELQAKVSKLDETLDELLATKTSLASKAEEIESLRDMLRDVGNDLVAARDEVKALQAKEAEDNGQQIRDLKEKSEGYESTIVSLEAKLKTAAANLQQSETARAEALKKLNAAVEELRAITSKYDELLSVKDAIMSKLSGSDNTVSELSESVKTLEASVLGLETSLEAKTREIGALLGKLASHEETLEALAQQKAVLMGEKDELAATNKELLVARSNDTTLKLEIATLKSSLQHKDKTEAGLEARIKAMETEKAALNDTVTSLKVSVGELKLLNKSALDSKNQLVSKSENLSSMNRSLEATYQTTYAEKSKLVSELEALKDQYEDLKEHKVSASGQAESIKKQSEELSMKFKEASNRVETLEEELNESQTMLQERTRESATIRKLLLEVENSQDVKFRELNARLKSLEEEKEEIENDYGMAMKRKQRELDDLKYITESLKTDLLRVETKFSKAKESLDKTTNLNKELQYQTHSSNETSDEIHETLEKLRESLNKSEKKARELENLNSILKKLNEDSSLKFERLTKNYKIVANQLKGVKEKLTVDASSHSNGSSPVSSRKNSIIGGVLPKAPSESTNVAYVKNIVLGFLERKEQRQQLLPVVKTLLDLDSDEEKRLLTALK
ncbi:hypothetical protein BABINDRAFT_162063 [Babjeviella inositovora NRRL Y-12698]|uniref:GRIP domain-containing protein n=1 Tax=Babjeviella inositovora NRRL Y-12698 TaxID=984486 RepID=A0A1E3QMT3_9ASCO|nr:uncharacterized protein BABINDRAFT_162063 [Babjeviella inositovora NRRL Y-12698]ODQ78981.1 hypothetical protein BABINDRAFT_162063 [Babjeviella inositovora NRRL Y-12698]